MMTEMALGSSQYTSSQLSNIRRREVLLSHWSHWLALGHELAPHPTTGPGVLHWPALGYMCIPRAGVNTSTETPWKECRGKDLKENQGALPGAPTPKLNVEWPSRNSRPDIYAGCAILSLHSLQQSPRRYNIHSSFHPWVCIKTHVHEVATAMFFNHTAKIFKNITHMCFKYRQIAGKAVGFTPACHSEL